MREGRIFAIVFASMFVMMGGLFWWPLLYIGGVPVAAFLLATIARVVFFLWTEEW